MANGLDEFNLQLSGELDQQQSKKNVNADIATLEKAIEHLKVQAEIDPKSVQNIAKQLSDILNQKIVVDNIQIDTAKATKTAQQVGQKIGDTVEKSVQQSLSIDDVIDKQVTDLMAKYSIAGKKGSKAFEEIRQAVVNYRKELASVDSAFDSDDIFDIFSNSADIRKVTSALTDHMKVADATKDTYASLAEYIKHVNNSGTKIHLPESIRQEYGDDFSSMRSQLGKAFTTGQGGDFESFITELNGQLGNVIDMSQGAESAFGDLVQKVNSAKGGNFLSGDELFKQGYLDRNEIERDITSAIDIIEEEEKKLAQVSTATANTVVQNEQKKQQAYQQTANTQKKVAESESIIKSGANVTDFARSNGAAREALEYFNKMLESENAVLSVSERFGKLNGLTSFTVNIKRATGEVESLRYSLENIGNKQNPLYVFRNSGAELNNSGAVKQIKAVENAFASFTQKIEQFKSTNNGKLSGLTQPLADFESKLAGLKSGTYTIDEVKNAFKLLQAEVSKIDAPLKATIDKFSATKTAVDNGKKSISDYREALKGLNNVPKELSQELSNASKLLMQINNIEKSEGTTANWSTKAREFTNMLDNIKGKIESLRKQQANGSTEIVYTKKDIENLLYVQKVMNTISKTEGELRTKLAKAGYTDIKIKGIEDATGKVKELEVTANNAAGALEKINFSRIKVQGGGKTQRIQDWLVQSGDVQVLKSATTAQEELTKSAKTASFNLADLKSKWESQGVLVGEFKTKVEQLESSLTTVGSKGELDKLTSQIKNLKTEASQIADVNKIQHSWSDGSYEAKYDSLIAKTRQWVDANDESVISIQKLTTAYNEFNQAASNFAKDGSVKNRDILIQKEEELGRQLKATTNDIKVQNAEWAKSSKVDSLHQKIQEFYDKNTATHRQWGGQLQNLLNETAHGAQVTATRVNEIEQEFLGVSNAARQTGKLGQSFFGGMIEQAKKFANWVSITTLLMRGFQELKQGVQFIKELDDALTDVAYTSNSSKSQLENLANSAVKMSKDLKASADNILEAVKIYSTAKSSADDILRKAQPAIMLSNISGMSGSESSKTINTALNQFELEDTEEGLLDITDTLQYVSSQLNYDFTEGIQQITEGLETSGSVAMNAGLSFQEYSAMVGLAVEKTGQAGSTIGQAYKTIFSRITKASATEGTLDEDISAAEKSLRSVGIQVRDSANEFRDLTDIMADLGKVWNSLSSVEKSNIGYNIAGIRQLNILNSLFGSWEDYASIMGDIDERTGTTLKNQEVYAESLAGHLGELEAVGQSVWNNIIQSETLKSGIDLLTGLLNIVDKTTDALGGLGTVGLAGGLLAGIKNVGQAKMWACLIYAYPC